MSHSNKKYKLQMIVSMFIFGSVGIIVSEISLPSAVTALLRAVTATLSIGAFLLLKKQRINKEALRKNALYLILSGAALSFDWIFLFESYRYTTVSVATLCYYMAPVFVLLLSPLIIKEKIKARSILCSLAAVAGVLLISGSVFGKGTGLKGVFLALVAACFYAAVILSNKFIKDQPAEESTFFQLAAAAAVMLVYVPLTQKAEFSTFSLKDLILILILGAFHTGFAYIIYFDAVQQVPAQITAVFSYIDPLTSVILSALILSQPMTALQIAGTVLILGATLFNELAPSVKERLKRRNAS